MVQRRDDHNRGAGQVIQIDTRVPSYSSRQHLMAMFLYTNLVSALFR